MQQLELDLNTSQLDTSSSITTADYSHQEAIDGLTILIKKIVDLKDELALMKKERDNYKNLTVLLRADLRKLYNTVISTFNRSVEDASII